MNDYEGTPIYEIKGEDGLTRFVPHALETIHEYIKAKQEQEEKKTLVKSGAV